MSYQFPLLSVLVLVSISVAPVIADRANAPPVELGQFVKKIIAAQRDHVLSWGFEADAGGIVTWQTKGVDGHVRVGNVLLAVNGFVPEVLNKSMELSFWQLRLLGDKFGVRALQISNDGCFGMRSLSENCIEQLSRVTESLHRADLNYERICEFGSVSGHSQVFLVMDESRGSVYLQTKKHGGSGGSFMEVNIYLRSDARGDLVAHNTTICSMLFLMDDGWSGEIADSYSYLMIGRPKAKAYCSPP